MAKPIRKTPTLNAEESRTFATAMQTVEKRKNLTNAEKFFVNCLEA
jgi:hypothetical protein